MNNENDCYPTSSNFKAILIHQNTERNPFIMDAVIGVLSSLIGQTKPVDTITVSNKHPRLDSNRDLTVREPEAEPLTHLSNYLSGIIRK